MATSNYSSYRNTRSERETQTPNHLFLLVIDMQNHFSSVAKPILDTTVATIQLCRRASIPVIFMRHCHKSPADFGLLHEWWNKDMAMDGTEDAELMPEIQRLVAGDDEVIEKRTYGAFGNTRLQERLVEMGVEEVIVTGVSTNLCCETTAREAFVRGFRVFFRLTRLTRRMRSCMRLRLKNMAHGFAYLVDCKRLEAGLFGA